MTVTELDTERVFDDFVKSRELTVVHFYAPWAAQCSQIDDVLEEMCKLEEYRGVQFGRVEAENVPMVSHKFGIAVVPTVLLLRNSCIVDRVDGVNTIELTGKVKHHLYNKDPLSDHVIKFKEPLEERLKKLTNQAPCMLFMKGNPAQPRCGFSRTIVSILDGYKADYKTFDILQDNEVREGLKKLSNWPTYPQLYINGDLIGGLDIVKEMSESGELECMLPKKESVEERRVAGASV
ncbi:PREDICTED: glutaredoxin-3 [Dinoponera quadriceps]|uniref:Glutaredoxin-3 n=1 Tax=Dinoponera quadriceps TaxID=609295 RepID=A0A6P3Y2S1_DINQU|nr:PREDICTED: glutaredoxin-3 [Dinoponera quadriceps]